MPSGWVGWDRIMFSSDYPHWDFDDPLMVLPGGLDAGTRAALYAENARRLYRIE